MKQQFKSEDEPILMSENVEKLTRFNTVQRRTLVLTGERVYLFHRSNLSRPIKIKSLSAIVKSTMSNQVVLMFPKGKDLRFKGLED